jgi:hypothetical protein
MLDIQKEVRSKEIEIMRNLIKDRGCYLYYLADEAKRHDESWETVCRSALSAFGCMKFRARFSEIQGLDDFLAAYLSDTTKQIFDSDVIEHDEKHIVIKAGYCPLMHAWVDCGGDDETVAKLCDIAMDGDRAMVNSIPALDFHLRKSLALGDHQCEFVVSLMEEEQP